MVKTIGMEHGENNNREIKNGIKKYPNTIAGITDNFFMYKDYDIKRA